MPSRGAHFAAKLPCSVLTTCTKYKWRHPFPVGQWKFPCGWRCPLGLGPDSEWEHCGGATGSDDESRFNFGLSKWSNVGNTYGIYQGRSQVHDSCFRLSSRCQCHDSYTYKMRISSYLGWRQNSDIGTRVRRITIVECSLGLWRTRKVKYTIT